MGSTRCNQKYPTNYIDHADGAWKRIHKGHGLDIAALWKDYADHHTSVGELTIAEVHLRRTPWMKWCSRHGGWGCDDEGEWHWHWEPVVPSETSRFTIVSATPEEARRG